MFTLEIDAARRRVRCRIEIKGKPSPPPGVDRPGITVGITPMSPAEFVKLRFGGQWRPCDPAEDLANNQVATDTENQ
jgi:hypothetical protein